MSLKSKYKNLLDVAVLGEIRDLHVEEQVDKLIISGIAPDGDVKNKLWDVYNQIDPNYISGEVLIEVLVDAGVAVSKLRVVTESTNLNVRKGPGIEQPIIGTALKDQVIDMISRGSNQWWLIRTPDGVEGYCYALYLQPV